MAEKKNKTNKRLYTNAEVIEALQRTGGIIREAMAILGMNKATFYATYRKDPEIDEAIKELRRQGFEQITDTLFDIASQGDIKAMHLYLKYNPLSKENGWTEQQNIKIEQEHTLTDEEKQALSDRLFGKIKK